MSWRNRPYAGPTRSRVGRASSDRPARGSAPRCRSPRNSIERFEIFAIAFDGQRRGITLDTEILQKAIDGRGQRVLRRRWPRAAARLFRGGFGSPESLGRGFFAVGRGRHAKTRRVVGCSCWLSWRIFWLSTAASYQEKLSSGIRSESAQHPQRLPQARVVVKKNVPLGPFDQGENVDVLGHGELPPSALSRKWPAWTVRCRWPRMTHEVTGGGISVVELALRQRAAPSGGTADDIDTIGNPSPALAGDFLGAAEWRSCREAGEKRGAAAKAASAREMVLATVSARKSSQYRRHYSRSRRLARPTGSRLAKGSPYSTPIDQPQKEA